MKTWLVHRDAALRVDTVIDATIVIAARAHADAFGVCIAGLDHVDGQRFAAALHQAEPHSLDPAEIDTRRTGVTWCRASSLEALAKVGGQVFGADFFGEIYAIHASHAVPVVIVLHRLTIVAARQRDRFVAWPTDMPRPARNA